MLSTWRERKRRTHRSKAQRPGPRDARLQPERDGRVRCSAWLGGIVIRQSLSSVSRKSPESTRRHPE